MMFTSKEGKGKAIFITLAIVLGLIAVVVFVFGADSIFKAVLFFIQAALVLGVIFGLCYLFWFLFLKKQKFDVNYVNKKKIIEAGLKQHRHEMKDLYLSGDKGHSRVFFATIRGYVRIQTLIRNYVYVEVQDEKTGQMVKQHVTFTNDRGEQVPMYQLDKIEQDCFVVKRKGIASLFQEHDVIRVAPEDHDDLVGDVTLFGFSLIPISEYWFLNSDHLDVRKIDYAILKEAERTIAFATLTDMKEIVDRATGVDASHKKNIESKTLLELPEANRGPQPPQY